GRLLFGVEGQLLRAGDVLVVDHDPDAPRGVELRRAHPRAHRGLAVHGAEGYGPDGRLDLEPLEGGDELGPVGAPGLPDALGYGLVGDVSDQRAEHRRLVAALRVAGDPLLVRRALDVVPRIAR